MSAPLKIDLHDRRLYNDIYVPIITARDRYIVMYGGRDSAKSYTAAQKIVFDLLNEPYFKGVMIRKVHRDIRDSQFATLKLVISNYGLNHLFMANETRCEITCLQNGNMMLSRGLDRDSKLKSIANPTMIWFEEADEIELRDFVKSDTSLRGPAGCLIQVIITCNPEHEGGWVRQCFFPPDKSSYERPNGRFHWVRSIVKGAIILHTTYRDNRFCSQDRRDLYEALANMPNPHYYLVYCLGLWGNALKGLVFEHVNYVEEFPDQKAWQKHGFGLDWGFMNDVTAICECVLAHGELWIKEHTYKRGLVNTKNPNYPDSPCVEKELEKCGAKGNKIFADGAEPKSVEEVRRAGYDIIGVKKPPGSVVQGITLMNRYRINIVGGSPNFRKEQRAYRYELDDDDEPTNKPIDANNHLWDAARYWCMDNLDSGSDFGLRVPDSEEMSI